MILRRTELTPPRRDLADASLAWMDRLWDEPAALLWDPPRAFPGVPAGTRHLVRETAWYALGLLLRGDHRDVARAHRALAAVAEAQFDEPGHAWHGTFARSPEEPRPSDGARAWIDYDPNWRQFLGTALAIGLRGFGEELAAGLRHRLERSLELAVEGEPEDRVTAGYANVALMKAWLDVEVGTRRRDPARTRQGEALAEQVAARFDAHGAFEEYNSPTYYAIDLYALALWREARSPRLRSWGRRLEAGLWRDVARFYHAGLRNLAGPFTRSYGMDMNRYAAGLGLWVWAALGRRFAPFPDPSREFAHAHDFCLGPCVALLGTRLPEGVRSHLRRFQGPRRVERLISAEPRRVATAWLDERLMIGAEWSAADWGRWDQYHAATLHWRMPGDAIGWIRLIHPGRIEARAEEQRLEATCHDSPYAGSQPTAFVIGARGVEAQHLRAHAWALPGLHVAIETDAPREGVACHPDGAEVRYARAARSSIRFVLRCQAV